MLAGLRVGGPVDVHILRQRNAWRNRFVCAGSGAPSSRKCAFFTADVQPMLMLDAVRLHTAGVILSTRARMQMWPLVVHARCVWLLHPLDTGAFLLYKLCMRELYQSARASSGTGVLEVGGFLQCVHGAVRLVLESRSWATAAGRVSLKRRQTAVSNSMRRTMQLEGYPTPAQHQACFLRNLAAPHALLRRSTPPANAQRPPSLP